jgi:hypothetical protein
MTLLGLALLVVACAVVLAPSPERQGLDRAVATVALTLAMIVLTDHHGLAPGIAFGVAAASAAVAATVIARPLVPRVVSRIVPAAAAVALVAAILEVLRG